MKNSIWITGASGRIGSELVNKLKKNTDYRVVGTDMDVDITNSESVEAAGDIYRPTVIINCSSLSSSRCSEENIVEAFKVNALGARNLAKVARKLNAKIIHLSTDDVFASNEECRITEFDTPNPNTVYGKSKLAGESFVRELNPKHVIVRSSWVYGAGDNHFLSYVELMADRGESFKVPTYKISTPTSANTLADFITELIDTPEYGIFHASCEGSCTRYEFACEILKEIGADTSLAIPEDGEIHSTLLENMMLKMTGIYEMPDWKEDLHNYIAGRI